MVSDNVIRTAKSTIVLLCILDFIFLPWDTQTLSYILNGNWQGLTLFLVLEQCLILLTRNTDWWTIITQTLSAISVQTILQLDSSALTFEQMAPTPGFSTVLFGFVILNATKNAGTVVLASNISRTVTCPRQLGWKVLGLGVITAVKALPLYNSFGETPLMATFTTLSRADFMLLTGFLFTRLFIGSFIQSIVVAVTKQGDLRMIFQRVGIRGFDMVRLMPEIKAVGKERVLEEEELVWGTGNLTFVVLGLWVTVTIIRGNF